MARFYNAANKFKKLKKGQIKLCKLEEARTFTTKVLLFKKHTSQVLGFCSLFGVANRSHQPRGVMMLIKPNQD